MVVLLAAPVELPEVLVLLGQMAVAVVAGENPQPGAPGQAVRVELEQKFLTMS
jgi:hypothetical protein